jgi:hypothetical protein
MTNYVMNPGKKRTRSRAKGSYRKRKVTWKMKRAWSRRRKAAKKQYAATRTKTFLKKLICRKGAAKRIARLKRSFCGAGAAESKPQGTFAKWFGWGKKGISTSRGASVAPSYAQAAAKLGFNPRRSRFDYRGRNPAMGILSSVTDAFSLEPIKMALPLMGGMAIANFGRRFVGGQGFMPAFLKSGEYGNLGLGVALSGLAAMLTGRFAPKYSSAVLVGGVAEAVIGAANKMFNKNFLASCGGCQGMGCIGCGALALAGGATGAQGGVYMDPAFGQAGDVFENQTAGPSMTAVDADVLDAFESEDIF